MILVWAFFYLFSSFKSDLPWATCGNYWNTGSLIWAIFICYILRNNSIWKYILVYYLMFWISWTKSRFLVRWWGRVKISIFYFYFFCFALCCFSQMHVLTTLRIWAWNPDWTQLFQFWSSGSKHKHTHVSFPNVPLDLQKVFDTVDHSILICKLEALGSRNQL